MPPWLDLHYAGHRPHLTTAGGELDGLDDLDHDLFGLCEV